jgi:hypothetical protein
VHRVEDAPVDRLQPVAHVRERPAGDDGHRVIDVRLFHLVFDPDLLDPGGLSVVGVSV